MRIRGLRLPQIDLPDGTDGLLDEYLATSGDDCFGVLSSGATNPDLLGENCESVEIAAGLRALRDPSVTPAVELAGLSFAYMLYDHRRLDDAFEVLECVDGLLPALGEATTDSPILPSEDPFYVGGLFLSHGDWHGDESIPEAKRWFERSLARGDGLLLSSVVHTAVALMDHRLGRFREAIARYQRVALQIVDDVETERRDAVDTEDGQPVFVEDLQEQMRIVRRQLELCAESRPPSAVLTGYGFAAYKGKVYRWWRPG